MVARSRFTNQITASLFYFSYYIFATYELIIEITSFCGFLAHLSHRLWVSYCPRPMSVVRLASSTIRFKEHLP